MKSRDEFERMIAALRLELEAARRWARAHSEQPFSAPTVHRCARLDCAGRMIDTSGDDHGPCTDGGAIVAVVVSRSLLEPGAWRVTTLCADGGPWGHTDHATHEEATLHAWRSARADLQRARFLRAPTAAASGLEVRA